MNIKSEKHYEHKTKQKRPPKEITPDYLRSAGLFYLQRFPASTHQFHGAMMNKVRRSCGFHKTQKINECEKLVDDLVKDFVTSGVLNDELYAQAMVTSLRRQGKSKRSIFAKLKIKGLGDDMIEKKLSEYDEERHELPADAELEAAIIFARKKRIGPFKKDSDNKSEEEKDKLTKKALGAMGRAGFFYDTVQIVFDMNAEEAKALIKI